MLTIGFTEKYYTLWNVGEPYEEKHYYNGLCIGSTWKVTCSYIQNLSIDLEKAKEKAESRGEYKMDLELRGHSSFVYTVKSDIKNREDYFTHDCFSYGRMEGNLIKDCEDVYQLERAYREEKSLRRRVCARRRLIELGRLVRYVWNYEYNDVQIRQNYIEPECVEGLEFNKIIDSLEKGHLFENGEKIELELKRIPSKSFSFDGSFGRTYIETYISKCGKLLKYMGGSPVSIKEDEFTKVKSTVKHSEYNGVKETKLIRIKVL